MKSVCVEGTQSLLFYVCVKSDVINHMTSPASMNETDIVYYKINWHKGIVSLKYQFIFTFIFNKCLFLWYLVGKFYSLFQNIRDVNINKLYDTKTVDFPCLHTYK